MPSAAELCTGWTHAVSVPPRSELQLSPIGASTDTYPRGRIGTSGSVGEGASLLGVSDGVPAVVGDVVAPVEVGTSFGVDDVHPARSRAAAATAEPHVTTLLTQRSTSLGLAIVLDETHNKIRPLRVVAAAGPSVVRSSLERHRRLESREVGRRERCRDGVGRRRHARPHHDPERPPSRHTPDRMVIRSVAVDRKSWSDPASRRSRRVVTQTSARTGPNEIDSSAAPFADASTMARKSHEVDEPSTCELLSDLTHAGLILLLATGQGGECDRTEAARVWQLPPVCLALHSGAAARRRDEIS